MTTTKPDASKKGVITLDRHTLKFPSTKADVTIEDISDMLDPVTHEVWGNHLYRIILTLKSASLKDSFVVNVM